MKFAFFVLTTIILFSNCSPVSRVTDGGVDAAIVEPLDASVFDAQVAIDAGQFDSGTIDSGIRDGGLCARCPPGAQCSEEMGCRYLCGGCETSAECDGDSCRRYQTFPGGLCIRWLPECADMTMIESVTLHAGVTCRSAACVVWAAFDADAGSLNVWVEQYLSDGGIVILDGGTETSTTLRDAWATAHPWCYSSNQFPQGDICVTHGLQVSMKARNRDHEVEFEYPEQNGILPSESVHSAALKTFGLAFDKLRNDAGFYRF